MPKPFTNQTPLCHPRPPRLRRRRGLTLVAVLWFVILLTLLITTLAKSVRIETRVAVSANEAVRLSWTCRAGLETALALLNEDDRAGDSLWDLWSDNDADLADVTMGSAVFDVEIVDEAGKLNVNTATREHLLALPDMTDDLADAILDWRDNDSDTSPRGAEGGYYGNLTPGYEIRNGHLHTVRELLLVKNITPELLYGEDLNQNRLLDDNERDRDQRPPRDDGDEFLDPGWIDFLTCSSYTLNRDATGAERVNINSADEATLRTKLSISPGYAKWIVENRQFKSIADLVDQSSPREAPAGSEDSEEPRRMDLQTFKSIADLVTISDDEQTPGLVNINTAPREVLAALLDGDETAAEAIVQHRQAGQKTMESIAELLDARQVDLETFKKIANHITTRSDVFTVHVRARSDQTRARRFLEAIVDRNADPAALLYCYEGTSN